jgi:tRNA threonylcarbamoyladenosine dehydratase
MRTMQTIPPHFSRSRILLGDAGLQTPAGKHIFIAGLGGVGSHCVEALARAGTSLRPT